MAIQRMALTRRQVTLGLAGAALAFPGTRNGIYNPLLAAHTTLWRAEMALRKKHPEEMIDEALIATSRAGYGRVEMIEEFLAPSLLDRTLGRLNSLKLECSVACASGYLHSRDRAQATRDSVVLAARSLTGRADCLGFRIMPHPDGKAKTEDELRIQAYQLNLLGQETLHAGMRLLLEHEDSEMQNDAREWRHMLAHTESGLVGLGLDVDCAVRAGVNPWSLIDTAGDRLRSVHLRNTTNGRPQEILADGDINLAQIASMMRSMQYDGYLVVELKPDRAWQREHSLAHSLAMSRAYTHLVFGTRPGYLPVDMGPHIRLPR